RARRKPRRRPRRPTARSRRAARRRSPSRAGSPTTPRCCSRPGTATPSRRSSRARATGAPTRSAHACTCWLARSSRKTVTATVRMRDDLAGVATLYAAHATDINTLADPRDHLAVADALGRLGLYASAAAVLAESALESTEAAVALAEVTLAAGDAERALARA